MVYCNARVPLELFSEVVDNIAAYFHYIDVLNFRFFQTGADKTPEA